MNNRPPRWLGAGTVIDSGAMDEPNMFRMLQVIRRHAGLLLLGTMAGFLLGLLLSKASSPLYYTEATLILSRDRSDIPLTEVTLNNEVELIRSRPFMADVLQQIGGADGLPIALKANEDPLTVLRDATSVRQVDRSSVLAVGANARSAEGAALIANAMADGYLTHHQQTVAARLARLDAHIDDLRAEILLREKQMITTTRDSSSLEEANQRRNEIIALLDSAREAYSAALVQRRAASPVGGSDDLMAKVLDRAVVPAEPLGLPAFVVIVLGAFLGICGSAALALMRDALDGSVRSSGNIRQLGLRCLGYLPHICLRRGASSLRWCIALDNPRGPYAETLRAIRAQAEAARGPGTSRGLVIGICATDAGEGTTTVAANLATLLSVEGANVLLIDANVRHPELSSAFAKPSAHTSATLTDIIATGANIADARPSKIDAGFAFLPLISAPDEAPPLYIQPGRLLNAITDLQGSYDHVIVDLPPLNAAAFVAPVLPRLDTWAMVARWGRTPVANLHNLFQERPDIAHTLLGVVINDTTPKRLRHYARYADRLPHA